MSWLSRLGRRGRRQAAGRARRSRVLGPEQLCPEAEQLAQLGYVAFAADMYGDGKVNEHPMEASQMAQKVRANAQEWRKRAMAALETLKAQPQCDPSRLAAIGYCFGGSTSLKLAYTGADIKAAVSFHGALQAA